jgi:hypothetical protein
MEGGPIGGDSQEGDDRWTKVVEFPLQDEAPFGELLGRQFLGRGGRAADEIGDPDSEIEQRPFLERREQSRRESRGLERRPEPVSGPGEMMAHRGRVEARIDPAKEENQARGDQVRDRPAMRRRDLVSCWLPWWIHHRLHPFIPRPVLS